MGLAEKIRDLAEQGDGADFRSDYSGRCMYGKSCIGVVVEDTSSFLMLFAYLAREVEEADLDDITNVRQDSMGRKIIYYWPSIQMEEDDEEDEQEDEETDDEGTPL